MKMRKLFPLLFLGFFFVFFMLIAGSSSSITHTASEEGQMKFQKRFLTY